MSAGARAVGEGQGFLLEANQEGIRRRDLEGVGGEGWCHVGESNLAGTTDGSRIEHITKGRSLTTPLPLLRDWNSTT